MHAKFAPAVELFLKPKNGLIHLLLSIMPFGKRIIYHLPEGLALRLCERVLYVNERIVELPFIFSNIEGKNLKILDAGCGWSTVGPGLAALGHKVWGIDINDYELTHKNFTFVKSDICKTQFEADFFDCVVSISVMEHIGLGYYGDPTGDAASAFKAAGEMARVLKSGGQFLVTVPYGKKNITASLEVFHEERLKRFLELFSVKALRYYYKESNSWVECAKEFADAQGLNERGRPNAIVLVSAVKK